jgi:hypothetical protein
MNPLLQKKFMIKSMRPESESGGNCGYYEDQVVVDRLPNTLVEFKLPLEKDLD